MSLNSKERVSIEQLEDREVINHPAFGQISVSRVSSSEDVTLYGSDLPHKRFIEICISTSQLTRQLSKDWPFARTEKVKVMLTEGQWCEFVSSLNAGTGTQCTFLHVGGEKMPGIDGMKTLGEKFESDVERDMEEAEKSLTELEALIESSGLSKKKVGELRNAAVKARRNITTSRAFVMKSFKGQMESVVQRAKVEINAHAKQVLGSEHNLLVIPESNESGKQDS